MNGVQGVYPLAEGIAPTLSSSRVIYERHSLAIAFRKRSDPGNKILTESSSGSVVVIT